MEGSFLYLSQSYFGFCIERVKYDRYMAFDQGFKSRAMIRHINPLI